MSVLLYSEQSSTVRNGHRREKTCLPWFANSKGADQPGHPRSLISAFVFSVFESIISKHATNEIFEETGLNLALSETRKTGFLATRPINDDLSKTL